VRYNLEGPGERLDFNELVYGAGEGAEGRVQGIVELVIETHGGVRVHLEQPELEGGIEEKVETEDLETTTR
jgi:hypothetical protein